MSEKSDSVWRYFSLVNSHEKKMHYYTFDNVAVHPSSKTVFNTTW